MPYGKFRDRENTATLNAYESIIKLCVPLLNRKMYNKIIHEIHSVTKMMHCNII
jgi:hypothetical protein